MDRPGYGLGSSQVALDNTAKGIVRDREGVHCSSRLSDIRGGLRELRARLRAVNGHITGENNPDDPKTPAPDGTAIAPILDDIENLVLDCSRMAQAIEANLA